MNPIPYMVASAVLVAMTSAYGGTALSDMHPEEAQPDNAALLASPGPHAPMIEEVQRKLHERGFDAGPINGAFGSKTQAALAQFQLAQTLPVSGALDDDTLKALGVARNADAEAAPNAEAGQAASGGTSEE